MNLDYLNSLPEWEEDWFKDDEGEEWKTSAERASAKALYLKWNETFGLITAFTENIGGDAKEGNTETHQQITKRLIFENAMVIAPKLISAARTDLYILQMENASAIRANAKQLMEQVGFAVLMGFAEKSYEKVVEEAMNEFRLLFRNWIATFEKDEFEDEWGLF